MKYIVTGSSGFIASNFVNYLSSQALCEIIMVDKRKKNAISSITSADMVGNLKFCRADIGEKNLVRNILSDFSPDAVFHFAAETHVDTSIRDPLLFVRNNINSFGIFLNEVHSYWSRCDATKQDLFRFVNISTDEVYGALQVDEQPFSENHPFKPNNPYSASKAAADCLVRSFFKTFGMPSVTIHAANNYGPWQQPEKLIPLMIHRALNKVEMPIYGDGSNMRDWLYVEDNCSAIWSAYQKGVPGEAYNIGAGQEISNNQVVSQIVQLLDDKLPLPGGVSYNAYVEFVDDRIGHDFRYSIDSSKAREQFNWRPTVTFDQGMALTVCWYLANQKWLADANENIK